MKKFLWVVIPIITLLASCVQNETLDSQLIATSDYFSASIANTVRTELDGTAVVWNEDDQLTIFTKTAHNRQYKIKSLSNDNRTATFGYVSYTGSDDTAIAENYALYPYNADATLVEGVVTSSLNATQVYSGAEGNLRNALMVAKSSNNDLAFENSTALVRFNVAKSIPDNYTLTAITLTSTANNIAGEVTINLANGDSKAVVTENGVKSVTLTDINTAITEEKQEFYVVLPAMNFTEGDLKVAFQFGENSREFALPAFELAQGGIKTIEYTISDTEDFTGTTPDNGEDFEGNTPGAEPKPADNEIWYTATAKVSPSNTSKFGATYVSNEWDETTGKGVITFNGTITAISSEAFSEETDLTSITIPDGVTAIYSEAFYGCTNLASVTMPTTLKTIGEAAFQSCSSLAQITIPATITYIDECGFGQCSNLKRVDITNLEAWCKIDFKDDNYGNGGKYANPLYNKADLYLNGELVTNLVIPSSITTINGFAFCGGTFWTITMHDQVSYIGEQAFAYCNNIHDVIIPIGVRKICWWAFQNCSNLKRVVCMPTTPPTGTLWNGSDWTPFTKHSDLKIYVPNEDYKTSWSDYKSYIIVNPDILE